MGFPEESGLPLSHSLPSTRSKSASITPEDTGETVTFQYLDYVDDILFGFGHDDFARNQIDEFLEKQPVIPSLHEQETRLLIRPL